MGSISHHITPLVIDSLGGGHTHKHAYGSSQTEAILRNQARAGLRPARAWFKMEVLLQTKVANSNLMNLRSIVGHNAGIIGKKILEHCLQ